MSLITVEGSHTVADTFDISLIDLTSVFGKVIKRQYYSESEQWVAVGVCVFAGNNSNVKLTTIVTPFVKQLYSNESSMAAEIGKTLFLCM